jgi:UDP-N-acetylglucosamine 2-epimerase (non-hydrolysing)
MRVLSVVGARPNLVKTAPVIAEISRRGQWEHVLVHTGQHYDPMMSGVFLEELGMPPPDHELAVGSGSHAAQTARVMERLEPGLEAERPDVVIVPGDVNSTLGAALAAVKLGIPLAHLESGLRSFDPSMPEEVNRIVADKFADYLFVHSDDAIRNLADEGIADDRVHFVGNTMIDALRAVEERVHERHAAGRMGLSKGDFLLVTLHRPSLVDGPLLAAALCALADVARELPVVFPVHPRTRARMNGLGAPGVTLLDPVGYLDFLSLAAEARAVLTDSGGVQEETTYLGVPCFTFRANTERPVTVRIGTNTVLGTDPDRIAGLPRLLDAPPPPRREPPPLWDGRAAVRVVDVLAAAA